jgi:hypothetical protein
MSFCHARRRRAAFQTNKKKKENDEKIKATKEADKNPTRDEKQNRKETNK